MALRAERRKSARGVAVCAVFAAAALALSYLEFLIPINLIIPLPGVKLGLANLAVVLALVYVSPYAAILVSVVRVALSSLLFGSPTSFALSLGGAALSLAVMLALYAAARQGVKMSYLGLCIASAAAHSAGQICAACILFASAALVAYMPVLMLFSILTGGATGILLNLSVPLTDRAVKNFGFGNRKRNKTDEK